MEVIFPAYHSVPIYIALPLAWHKDSPVPARNAEIERDINKYGYRYHSPLGFPIFHTRYDDQKNEKSLSLGVAFVRD